LLQNFGGEEDTIFCGVFDGHGPMGHKISRHVCENLPSRVHSKIRSSKSAGDENIENNSSQSQEELFREFEDILVTFFKQIDSELGLDSPYDSFCSGTTAVTVFKQVNQQSLKLYEFFKTVDQKKLKDVLSNILQADCLVIANLGHSRAVLGTRSKNSFKAVQLTVDLKPCVQR